MVPEPVDPFAPALALRAPELLREFNRAGILDAADVHVARTLSRISSVEDPRVLLAIALAARAPRLGHVFVDLETAHATVLETDVEDPGELDWPPVEDWIESVAGCEQLIFSEPDAAAAQADSRLEDTAGLPLRLDGTRLYLARYWQEERALTASLSELAQAPLRQLDLSLLAGRLGVLFPEGEDRLQRAALAAAALRGLTVIAGGPGTGKTTTIARLVALLCERAADDGRPAPLIGLCAPTGKASARLTEEIQSGAEALPVGDSTRSVMMTLGASTIHRLLGWLPGGRFRHNAASRLPHDVVIVDETSMVPLSLMVRLIEAVRRDAQVVLVGDPDQLTAIEAGAVLRDIVGPAADGVRFGAPFRSILERATGDRWADAGAEGDTGGHPRFGGGAQESDGGRSFGDGVVMLRRGHRFGAGIGALADAIRSGDADATVEACSRESEEIIWYPTSSQGTDTADADDLPELRAAVLDAYGSVIESARAGDAEAALSALGRFRLLCAHRRGRHGVSHWTSWVERELVDSIEGFEPSERNYIGRPLLITENDHELRLNNGDTGVIVEGAGAVFERDGATVSFAPSRLGEVEPLYAMTIHKSQGSQFEVAAVVLPEPDSRILTRELLYTAVTRARRRLILVGSEESLRAAVLRPVARATGLRELLWGR